MKSADTTQHLNLDNISSCVNTLTQAYAYKQEDPFLIVSASKQTLFLIQNQQTINTYKISTAQAGIGCLKDSFQTPFGIHKISEKIGNKSKLGSIFKGRKETGEIAKILHNPNERSPVDNITSRILWLDGLEKGVNKGGDVDSHSRYIYIHGTDEEGLLGTPASHGCIRMGNESILSLFEKVNIGTFVCIID